MYIQSDFIIYFLLGNHVVIKAGRIVVYNIKHEPSFAGNYYGDYRKSAFYIILINQKREKAWLKFLKEAH